MQKAANQPTLTPESVDQTHSPLEQESTSTEKESVQADVRKNRREKCCSKNLQKQMTLKTILHPAPLRFFQTNLDKTHSELSTFDRDTGSFPKVIVAAKNTVILARQMAESENRSPRQPPQALTAQNDVVLSHL
nr:hypothetical protein [Tanacetum cinerariifolium]